MAFVPVNASEWGVATGSVIFNKGGVASVSVGLSVGEMNGVPSSPSEPGVTSQ